MIHGMVNVICEFYLNHRRYVLNSVVKAVKKVAQGLARDEGKTWFIQLKDKCK